MKPESISRKHLITYCISLFLVSWALQLTAIFATEGFEDPRMSWWLGAAMLTPSIVTIFFLRTYPSFRAKLLWRPSWNLIYATFLAVLVPILMGLLVLFVTEYFHWGKSQWFNFLGNEVGISGGPFVLGLGNQTWIVFALNLFLTGLVFALLNSFVAAGEELAWRGLLQGLLIERLGMWKGILLLGFIWSMWHLPIQLAGYNYPQNPILGSLLISPLLMISYSVYLAWITVYSKSFIPAAISHGALNGIQEGIIYHIDLNVPEINIYITRVFSAAVIALIFAIFMKRKHSFNLKKPFGPMKAGH